MTSKNRSRSTAVGARRFRVSDGSWIVNGKGATRAWRDEGQLSRLTTSPQQTGGWTGEREWTNAQGDNVATNATGNGQTTDVVVNRNKRDKFQWSRKRQRRSA